MPEINTPKNDDVIDDVVDTVIDDRSEDLLDNLFGDTPIKKEEVKPDKKPAPKKEKVEKKEVDNEDGDEEEVNAADDEDEDWDAPVKKPSEEDEDEDPANETIARKQAKERGREAKALKAQLAERQLEIDRIAKERDEATTRLQELQTTRLKPEDHPEYTEAKEAVLTDVRASSRRLPGQAKVLLPQKFGTLMAEYQLSEVATGEDVLAADLKLAGAISDSLQLSEIPFKDLDDDERAALQPTIDKVVDLLERNAGPTKALQKLHARLSDKAKSGNLSIGVRAYEQTVAEFKPVLEAVGDLADDVIEANPYAIESVVARMAKESPEAKKRLERARADVLEVLVGPRALTQTEIDKMEANGTDMKSFFSERTKAHALKQKKFAAMFVQGLMTRAKFKEVNAELQRLKADSDADDSELDALDRVTKKTGKIAKKEVRPSERPDPLSKLFPEFD